jgi:hypothetical protein
MAAVALPVGAFDYLENHAVAQMIDAGAAGLTAGLVATASKWTVLKAGASTLAMSVVLFLLLWRAAQRLVPWLKTVTVRRSPSAKEAPAQSVVTAARPMLPRSLSVRPSR